ncbi:MAG: hypothetical protein IJC26_07675 [Clostridia bacterium]|nr:hypothetical protein [Clostridia bacterium]
MKTLKKMTAVFLALLFVLGPCSALPFFTEGFAANKANAKTVASATKVEKGDTVTISVELDHSVNARGFGLDFGDSIDSSAFELLEADWSETVKKNSMMSPVDSEKGIAVSAAAKAYEAKGVIFSFKVKVKASAGTYHFEVVTKLTDPDAKQSTLATVGTDVEISHECVRGKTYEKNANDHWKACTVSGCTVTFDKGAHVYDNDDDLTCNTCSYERKAAHKHDFSVDDFDAEHHWKKCSVCGFADESTKAAHSGESSESGKLICKVCKQPYGNAAVQPPKGTDAPQQAPEQSDTPEQTQEATDVPGDTDDPSDPSESSDQKKPTDENKAKKSEVWIFVLFALAVATAAFVVWFLRSPGRAKKKGKPNE